MKLYYEDTSARIRLYHGDCINDVQEWADASVMITDPPYGMAFRSGQRFDRFDKIEGDQDLDARDNALQIWTHIVDARRAAAVFGTWRFPRPAQTAQVLIWYKQGAGPGMGDLGDAFGTCHEEIYLIGEWPKQPKVKRHGSVLTTTGSPSDLASRIMHPTPKPVGLMEILIAAAPLGMIADPFAGSGSTLVAARNLGRPAVGVEINEKYCEIAAKRLSQTTLEDFL